jgi:hypothetical protein
VWGDAATGAELPDQNALGHLFEPQRGDHPIDVRLLGNDQLVVDPSGWLNQAFAVFRQVLTTVKVLQLRLQIAEARHVLQIRTLAEERLPLPPEKQSPKNSGPEEL